MSSIVLHNCADTEVKVYANASGNVTIGYIDKVVTLDEYPGCWYVENTFEPVPGETLTVTNCFPDCETCGKTSYRLVDCLGRLPDIYSIQDNLEGHVGSIIKIPYYNNECFTVSLADYNPTTTYYTVTFSNVYQDCSSCRQKETIEPLEPQLLCDPKEVEKVYNKMGDIYYQEIVEKRFGMKHCCPEDFTKWFIRMKTIEYNLINHLSPDLPEPIVLSCCVNTQQPCQTNCDDCNQTNTEEECFCNCNASENSPHDCHTYTFTVTTEMIDLATGNDDTNTNGKVYFAHFPCGGTAVRTEEYNIDTVGDKELCVLGIPLLGYFANNEWVTLEETTRGAVCEEEINECQTCN